MLDKLATCLPKNIYKGQSWVSVPTDNLSYFFLSVDRQWLELKKTRIKQGASGHLMALVMMSLSGKW